MRTVLLPCAGRSARYPGLPPKWLLTTPDGDLAIERAAASIAPAATGRRVIAILAEHEAAHGARAAIRRAFGPEIEILVLDQFTAGPAETVSLMIERAGVRGPIAIKDADSWFDPPAMPSGSFVATIDLRRHLGLSRVAAKSFVEINEQNLVAAVIEKHVASNFVSAGLYGFADAGQFSTWYRTVARETGRHEIFVSHVISEALRQGEILRPCPVTNPIDVGTLDDWHGFTRSRQVMFVPIDGVVFTAQGRHTPPYWGDPPAPIEQNVAYLRALQHAGAQLVFLSSRGEEGREQTLRALHALGLSPHALVMGCLHGKQVLVGAFEGALPCPAATAVNLPRNSAALNQFLP
jgi:hypothetical protein